MTKHRVTYTAFIWMILALAALLTALPVQAHPPICPHIIDQVQAVFVFTDGDRGGWPNFPVCGTARGL